MKIYIDGSGFNFKESRYCVYSPESNRKTLVFSTTDAKTNNEMEYAGLIQALQLAQDGDEIITDSQLIIGQTTLGWRCNHEHLRVLVEKCKKILENKKVKLTWVPRQENLAGRILDGEH